MNCRKWWKTLIKAASRAQDKYKQHESSKKFTLIEDINQKGHSWNVHQTTGILGRILKVVSNTNYSNKEVLENRLGYFCKTELLMKNMARNLHQLTVILISWIVTLTLLDVVIVWCSWIWNVISNCEMWLWGLFNLTVSWQNNNGCVKQLCTWQFWIMPGGERLFNDIVRSVRGLT